jgi:putative DNA methylase
MGGGTTLVEGARLGMQMTGNDLNPVAWLVVKNELADVDLDEVNKLFDYIEDEVKAQIMPFYACEGPDGEKGIWIRKSTGEKMNEDFDPLALTPEERKDFDYDGPEVIYTFWAKHGPCSAPGCGHRTPLMSSLVVAVKTLSVKTWQDITCSHCHQQFDVETAEARMAPDAPLTVAETEKPYTIIDPSGKYECPNCHHEFQDESAAIKGDSIQLPKKSKKNKKIDLTLLVHPDWLKGSKGTDSQGHLGGSANSNAESTARWNNERLSSLKLVEVRGKLPEMVTCSETGVSFDPQKGTIPKKANFTCQESTCGRKQELLASVKETGETGPVSAYALQCFSPKRAAESPPYRGRYFAAPNEGDIRRQNAVAMEWGKKKGTDLEGYWPTSEVPYGFMTSMNNGGIPNHGYSHWATMFNERQLLVLSLIMKAIDTAYGFDQTSKNIVIGAFQQFVRNENMFCFWDIGYDKLVPHMSNNNYHPKTNIVENCVFPSLGRGNWASCRANTIKGLEWCKEPWETVSNDMLSDAAPDLGTMVSGKSEKANPNDPVLPGSVVTCGSSTELSHIEDSQIDMVVTDPPFGGLLHYSELADFFYVWVRLALKDKYPDYFAGEYTPKTLEAVSNRARHPDDPDAFYKRLLTECWREAKRILKPGGILSFTFHHSEDGPWVDVLESLFNAGFYLEATYPIRSDETKGEGAKPGTFGSQTIEYDIIHVCRKQTEEPKKISWPRLRRQILADVRQLQSILEHHQNAGLPKADIQVIKRGKALVVSV